MLVLSVSDLTRSPSSTRSLSSHSWHALRVQKSFCNLIQELSYLRLFRVKYIYQFVFIYYCYNNRVDVRGRKYVFGPTQAHFSPSRRRGLKWVLRRAKNIFTPKNINSITIIIISEGIHKRNQRQYSKRSRYLLWTLPESRRRFFYCTKAFAVTKS